MTEFSDVPEGAIRGEQPGDVLAAKAGGGEYRIEGAEALMLLEQSEPIRQVVGVDEDEWCEQRGVLRRQGCGIRPPTPPRADVGELLQHFDSGRGAQASLADR